MVTAVDCEVGSALHVDTLQKNLGLFQPSLVSYLSCNSRIMHLIFQLKGWSYIYGVCKGTLAVFGYAWLSVIYDFFVSVLWDVCACRFFVREGCVWCGAHSTLWSVLHGG